MADVISFGSPPGEPGDPDGAGEAKRAVAARRSGRRALVILGMHRSGTSALARVLGLSGAALPRHVVPARAGAEGDSNTRSGFWESAPLLALHEEALASAGATWDAPFGIPESWFETEVAGDLARRLVETIEAEFGAAPVFVAKDPRISLLAPLWKSALQALDVEDDWLIAVRHPLSVAASLQRRDGFAQAKGLLLWLTHFLAAERHTRDRPRLFVRYDDLLESWRAVVRRLGDHFGFHFSRRSYFAAAEIDDFVDPGLRHHTSEAAELAARDEVAEWVEEAYRWALEASAGSPSGAEILDAISRAMRQAELLYGPLVAAGEIDDRRRRAREAELEREIESLRRAVPGLVHPLVGRRDEPGAAGPAPAMEPPPAAEPPPAVEPLPAAELRASVDPPPAADAPPEAATLRVRTLAFFLPQYHPIPENDAWWGPGFTEWTSVTSARPWFEGHVQPLLPADLGFYDLRLAEVRARQAELAREHGISGFCYYFYSFAGRRLLSRPLEEILASGEPDFPFCLCWANENWTRRWDGQDDEILLAQAHSPESDARFIEEVLPALLDPRYVRSNGEPLLLVYRADLLADPLGTSEIWRETARRAGLPGLHLCAVWNVEDPRPIGFDALVEFPPHHFPQRRVTGEVAGLAEGFEGEVFDYAAGVAAIEPLPDRGFPVYRGVMPGWDNTPRRGKWARIFAGSTPDLYGRWLEKAVRETAERPGTDDQFVFINAWNEWAEGATLEPSRAQGRAYLEATREALRAAAEERTELDRLEERMNDRLSRLAETVEALGGALETIDSRVDQLLAVRAEPASPPDEAEPGAAAADAPASLPGIDLEAAEATLDRWRSALASQAGHSTRDLWLSPSCGLVPLLFKLPLWLVSARLPSRLGWWRRARRILESGRFDPADYLQRNPEVGREGLDPLYHYVRCGEAEGRDPRRSGWRINPAHARSRSASRRPVLVVSHDAARAGAQLILLESLEHLARDRDLEVFVLLLEGGDLGEEFESRFHTLRLDRVAAATGASREEALHAVLAGFLWRRPLAVWCNTVVTSEAAVASRRLGLPVLSLVYELPTSIDASVGRRGFLDLVEASRRVIVASRSVQESLAASYGVDRERLTPLHTGVFGWDGSDGWREPCRAAVLAEFGLPADAFLVLGCGTIHPRKGTDLFVQVAREAVAMGGGERSFFLWIGPDQDHSRFREWCEHDVRETGLGDRVRLAGGRRSTRDYFGAADAFALTSREDPFPMVVLEAMARGVPVVAFAGAGGAPEVLGDGAGIVVAYLDVKEMARSLVSLCEAPRFHSEVGRRARLRIETDHRWSDYVRRLVEVFESDFGYRPGAGVEALR